MSHDNITDPPPLDPAQVVRISAVHRGYLYQHLYVTGCLLTVARTARLRIIVERDEDMEAVGEAERLYVQIKTRGRSLQPADIAEALARFDDLRAEHAAGRREGVARFVVVSNVDPGPHLPQELLRRAAQSAPFSLSDPEQIKRLLSEVGLLGVRVDAHDTMVSSGDLESMVEVCSRVGALGAILREHPDLRARAVAALRAALAQRDTPSGPCLRAATWVVSARVSSDLGASSPARSDS